MKFCKRFINILMRTFKRLKIKDKALISYSLVLIIPVLIISIVTSSYSSKIVYNETVQLTLKTVEQIKNNIEYNFKDMDTMTNTLYTYNSEITPLTSYLESEPPTSQYERLLINRHFKNFFLMLSYLRNDLSAIHIFGTNGTDYKYYRKKIEGIAYSREDTIYKNTIQNGHKTLLTSTHKQFYSNQGIDVFSLSRQILDNNLEKFIAVVIVDFELQSLRNICKNTKLNLGETIIICDGDGNTIYNTNEENLYEKVSDELLQKIQKQDIQVTNYQLNNISHLLISDTNDTSGLKIFFLIPQKNILIKSQKLVLIIIIISLVSLLLALGIAYYFALFITKPIKNLSASIKMAEAGNISIRAQVENEDEIGELTESFNSMISRIQFLIDQEYKMELIKKEAELKALMAQVNPHFIYNTLELISGATIDYNIPMINQITKSLGQMLRYSIKTGNDVVTLEQELHHLGNYLKIHDYRFEDELQVIYSIDEEYKQLTVLKLTLQPIVENAIHHGIQRVDRRGLIRISAMLDQGTLSLKIFDNGIGMTPFELSKVNKTLLNDCEKTLWDLDEKESIGLRNVNARLFLYYGRESKLDIQSEYNVGTTVTINIPVN